MYHKDEEIRLKETIFEEIILWLQEHNGEMPRGFISINGKQKLVAEMTQEEKYEKILYSRWYRCKVKQILDKYIGRPIEDVPEEYREKITSLRKYGLGLKEKTVYEEIIEWLEEHNGVMPRGTICENGEQKVVSELTKDQKEERNLYARWRICEERKIIDKYSGRPIEEVPEKFKEKIVKLRDYGLGLKERRKKTTYEEILEWLGEHNGMMPRGNIKFNGKKKLVAEMTKEEREERNLYARWMTCEERKIAVEYLGRPIEEVPDKYREKITKLRSLWKMKKRQDAQITRKMRGAVAQQVGSNDEVRRELEQSIEVIQTEIDSK